MKNGIAKGRDRHRHPRSLHHAVTLNIRGNSYLLKEKLKAGPVRAEEATDS